MQDEEAEILGGIAIAQRRSRAACQRPQYLHPLLPARERKMKALRKSAAPPIIKSGNSNNNSGMLETFVTPPFVRKSALGTCRTARIAVCDGKGTSEDTVRVGLLQKSHKKQLSAAVNRYCLAERMAARAHDRWGRLRSD
ncbi:hypothetical protein EVAR_45896_1 [Eumeta japonica]|uniref:Uncharacterized protein n=1 Tax=Eumeta variegata TaxID=151549 RepID=A0A4C1XV08_EUMVA|nr:hypothetical protein EVAR_45896_1 [Eumeta japonica]